MPMNKKQLQKKGPKGHKLAHITPLEGVILKALGGSGKVDPNTGVTSYEWGADEDEDEHAGEQEGGEAAGGYGYGGGDDFGGIDSGGYDPAGDTSFGGIDSGGYDPSGGETGATGETGDISGAGDTGGDTSGDTDWSYNPFDYFFGDRTPDWGRWYTEVFKPWFTQKHGREPTKEEKEQSRLKLLAEQNQGDGGNISVQPGDEPPPDPVWTDWEGNEYTGPTGEADAEAANQVIRDTKFGETEAFGYGDDSAFSGTEYESTYEQMLADAYSAAKRGSNRAIGKLGYDPGTGVTEGDLTEQQEWLTGLGTDYQAKNQAMYDAWYAENRAKIDAIKDPALVDAYVWTDKPAYDLDYTGGAPLFFTDEDGNQVYGDMSDRYDPDYIPEFFEGFNLEFEPGYSDPTMPTEWGGHPEGYVAPVEGDVSSGEVSSAAPQSSMMPKTKTRIKAPTSVGLSPFSRGSAKYR